MSTSSVGHSIRWKRRLTGQRDNFMTPPALAAECVALVPGADKTGQLWLDPFRGERAFYDAFPKGVTRAWCEISEGRDFFKRTKPVDWCVSNPPYSILDRVLEHSQRVSRVGYAYLCAMHALTTKRLQQAEAKGFALTRIHLFKVMEWFGMGAFLVFEKGEDPCVTYSRVVRKFTERPPTKEKGLHDAFAAD